MLIKKIGPQTSRRISTNFTWPLNSCPNLGNGSLQQAYHNLIVQDWPEVFNGLVISRWMDAVSQQDDRNKTIQIHPKRGSSETKMTHTVGRKIAARTRILQSRCIKTKGLVFIRQALEK